MWPGVTGEPSWGKGGDASAGPQSLGPWARGTLRLKMCGAGRVAWVPGGEGGSREVQLIHLPQPIPPSRSWTTVDCYAWQGVGLRSVLLYFG